MYRASAFLAAVSGIDITNEEAVAALLSRHSIDASGRGVFIDGEDVSESIRTSAVSEAASVISTHRSVRLQMVALQRAFGARYNTVAEGRDMGTVVFPDASLKVYVVADLAIRAVRRLKDLGNTDMNTMVHSMFIRDHRDRTRLESPLRLPPGAVWLDGTVMSVTEQVNFILEHYRKKCMA
jgi:cytidylate kinase